MEPITIKTIRNDYHRAYQTSSDATSFASCLPKNTAPEGEGVLNCTSNLALIVPFGTDGDGEIFDIKAVVWRRIGSLWVAIRANTFTCTLSSSVPGIAGAPVTNSEYFADTIASIAGSTAVDYDSPANNTEPGWVMIDCKGGSKLQILIDVNTAESGNALVAFL